MKSLLLTLARELVTEPGQVRVWEHVYEDRSVFELSVADVDRGRVIGRNGRTADALRAVLDAVARRRGTRSALEIVR